MSHMRADLIAKIEMARDGARVKKNAYRNLASKQYDYWRARAASTTYDEALSMFARGTEHKIPDMAVRALAHFDLVRDDDTSETILAFADGRRDALATVADWMNNR